MPESSATMLPGEGEEAALGQVQQRRADLRCSRLFALHKGGFLILSDILTPHQAVAEKMVPLAKKIVKEWYGEKPENSPDYCRIGRGV